MRRHFLPLCLSSFAFTACLMLPEAGRAAAAPEIVRVGDRDMTCTALAAEINGLAQPEAAAAAAPAKPKKHGFGFLKVLSSAVPMVGMVGGIGGALASSAAGAAQMAGSSAPADTGAALDESNRMAREALAGGSPAQQRKARLTAIFEDKRC